jgi:hypothetical protein
MQDMTNPVSLLYLYIYIHRFFFFQNQHSPFCSKKTILTTNSFKLTPNITLSKCTNSRTNGLRKTKIKNLRSLSFREDSNMFKNSEYLIRKESCRIISLSRDKLPLNPFLLCFWSTYRRTKIIKPLYRQVRKYSELTSLIFTTSTSSLPIYCSFNLYI